MFRYTGPFAFLVVIPLLYRISDVLPIYVPGAILLALLVTHHFHKWADLKSASSFRLLPILYIPIQLAMIAWATRMAAQQHATSTGFISLAFSIGVCTGVFGVLAAHEMVHSRVKWHRRLGNALLAGMSYRHFRIAHIYCHHRYAGTYRDASTARAGESFYTFLARTLPAQWLEAWRFEHQRCRGKFLPFLQNAVLQDMIVMTFIYAALLCCGWRAAAFFAAESAIAILVLEAFNYVAHYGLIRRTRNGRLEPMADHHSWNSGGAGNLLIFNMGCHSHHHRAPSKSYEGLKPVVRAPMLPGGYAGAILLALIPPLWCAVMDKRALAAGEESEFSYAPDCGSAIAHP